MAKSYFYNNQPVNKDELMKDFTPEQLKAADEVNMEAQAVFAHGGNIYVLSTSSTSKEPTYWAWSASEKWVRITPAQFIAAGGKANV